jgi:protease IV
MAFLRKTWRILVGVKDALALIALLIFFAVLYAFLSSGPNPGAVRDGALYIELDGTVSEQPAAIDPLNALISQRTPVREYRQRDIVRALDLAVTDARVKAIGLTG